MFLKLSESPRSLVDASLAWHARRRWRTLDRLDIASVQSKTLLSLVRKSAQTQFGSDHGFRHIHTVKDFQRQVSLRTYEDFWEHYWRSTFPILDHISCAERIPYLALSSGTTLCTTKYIPVSPSMLASNRKAALTTLALFLRENPSANLCSGRMFFLGGSTALQQLHRGNRNASVLAGDLSGIAAREVPAFTRAFTFPGLDLALETDWDRKLDLLAEQSARLPITAISGVPSWLVLLFERMMQATGKSTMSEIWPALRLVIHGGTRFDPYRTLFKQMLGDDRIQSLETYPASEGFIATEDPRYQLLRLIPDHGIFFEFVPVSELGSPSPTRHVASEVELGQNYAVVLTTCAGLWSYILGDTVCFESSRPPLLRFTGRTKYFLSAFGEHLISEEVEKAMTMAAESTHCTVRDFHVGPLFPDADNPRGRHAYVVEFVTSPASISDFSRGIDESLSALNEDYAAHRRGGLGMAAPELITMPGGGFANWMRSRGKLGGQNKVPRMDNTGTLTRELTRWALQGTVAVQESDLHLRPHDVMEQMARESAS